MAALRQLTCLSNSSMLNLKCVQTACAFLHLHNKVPQCSHCLALHLPRLSTANTLALRCNSTLASQFKKAVVGANKRPLFWTSEADPANHSSRHEGFFYTISNEDFTRWLGKGLHHHSYQMVKAFNEVCLMVRQPAIEIIEGTQMTDHRFPVVRYVLYGRDGCGKSTSLAHVMHFCGTQGWLVAHIPWAAYYNRYYKEAQPSVSNPSLVDQPLEAADFLTYFRKMNEPVIKNLDLKTTESYVWSKRETTEIGTSLLELIDFGLARVKYACDVMGALLHELRQQSSSGKCKTLVAIDGVNSFWTTTTIKREDNRGLRHTGEDLTIVDNWKKMLQNNWCGGAVVCTVDPKATQPFDVDHIYPVQLLTKPGFELLDPFIPIRVTNYSEKEAYSCIEYFKDRKWITHTHANTDEGRRELMSLSSNNPLELYTITINW